MIIPHEDLIIQEQKKKRFKNALLRCRFCVQECSWFQQFALDTAQVLSITNGTLVCMQTAEAGSILF
jgi:hypothetical protein